MKNDTRIVETLAGYVNYIGSHSLYLSNSLILAVIKETLYYKAVKNRNVTSETMNKFQP